MNRRLVFVMFFLALPLSRLDSAPSSADTGFAEFLFTQNDFSGARLEYERLLFYSADSLSAARRYFRIGQCSMRLNAPAMALKQFRKVALSSAWGDSARLLAAQCALQTDQPGIALDICAGLNLEKAPLTRAYARLLLNQYAEAKKELSTIKAPETLKLPAGRLLLVCDTLAGFKTKRFLPAAVLAIVPGLGHCYTGRFGDALFSAAVVASFSAVAAYYAYFNSPVRAVTFGTLAGLFYAGSIYGAIVSVKIYNYDSIIRLKREAGQICFTP